MGFVLVPLSAGKMFFYWDNAQQHYPQTAFLHDALQSGRIPHWWPQIGSGLPTVAEGQSAHYHPVRVLLAWLFSSPVSFMLEIGVYLSVAGIGTFLFLREFRLHSVACFVGGVCQMFGSFSTVFIRNMVLHRSSCLLPVAFLLAERFAARGHYGYLLGAGIVFGLQLLAGHPTFAVITILATSTYLMFRLWQRSAFTGSPLVRRLRTLTGGLVLWGLGFAFGAGLAAVQFIPQLMHVGQSMRQGGLRPEYASLLPAQLRYLPQLALPYAYLQGDWPDLSDTSGRVVNLTPASGIYLGAFAVVLPVLAIWWRRRGPDPTWPLGVCFVLAVGFALGWNTPLFPALGHLPGLSGLRFPSRFLMWASFCLACLTAIGLHRLTARSRVGHWQTRDVVPFLGVGTAVVLVALGFWTQEERLARAIDAAPHFRAGIVASMLLVMLALALTWALRVLRRPYRELVLLLVAVVALADLLVFRSYSGYAPAVSIEEALAPPDVAERLGRDPDQFRVMSLIDIERGLNRNEDLAAFLQADGVALWGLDSADAWCSLFLKRHYALRESVVWELTNSPDAGETLRGFLGTWNVKYVVGPATVNLRGWQKVHETEKAIAWQNPDVLARAYVVGRVIPENVQLRDQWYERSLTRLELYHFMSADWASRLVDSQIVDNVMTDQVDYRTTAIIEGPDAPRLSGTVERSAVVAGPAETDRMSFDVESDRSALLVISSNYYPGWTATVNGQPARIFRANYTSMGIAVPQGRSGVVLQFVTPGFRLGAVISVISALFCALCLAVARIRTRPWLAPAGTPRSPKVRASRP